MININIPGFGQATLENLVLDFNGTIAKDGNLIEETMEPIKNLSKLLNIHVLTADTFGTVDRELSDLPVSVVKLGQNGNEIISKSDYISALGTEKTVAVGNGANDEGMLLAARIGICIIGNEGCSARALKHADLISTDIVDALELLLNPDRLKATLRY